MPALARLAAGLLGLAVALAAVVAWLNVRGEAAIPPLPEADPSTPQLAARGAYLARVGNCAGCHTDRGGAAYAGGKGIETPFGTVYAGNLTPDLATGIGSWTSAHFWRALHHGRSKDGRLLYPAFPYPSYTLVTREDADALYAYLRSQVPVHQPNKAHALRFPYDTQAALAVWRALFFAPAAFQPQPQRSAEWNRGAYLVRGLGHCAACHAPRNAFGATNEDLELSGGLIPMQRWAAPSLAAPDEAGVAAWSTQDVVDLLKTGRSARGSALGPMASVVFHSTRHLDDADARAMAEFLRALPQQPPQRPASAPPPDAGALALGARLYRDHCAQCHGDNGEGAGPYPALAGNRTVTMRSPANLLAVITHGGYTPETPGNPRPYGMPPFAGVIDEAGMAALATYLRSAWGNAASEVRPVDLMK